MGFLQHFLEEFPFLKGKKLYLTGESVGLISVPAKYPVDAQGLDLSMQGSMCHVGSCDMLGICAF